MNDREPDPDPQPTGVLPSRRQSAHAGRVDPDDVLERLDALDVCYWDPADEGNAATRLGPAAEDFQAAFELGVDADRIAAGDPDGVALAAIQGLTARLADQRDRLARQDRRIEAQQETITEQRDDLESLRSTVESLVSGVVALRAEVIDHR